MGRALVLLVGLLVALLAAWVLGALVGSWLPRGWLGLVLGGVAALAVCIALPVWMDRKLLSVARRAEPGAPSALGQSFLLVDTLVLAVLLVALPRQTRGALDSRGDWVLLSPAGARQTSPLQAWVRRAAHYIPRSGAPKAASAPETKASARAARGLAAPVGPGSKPRRESKPALENSSERAISSAASAAQQGPIPEDQPVQGPADVFRKYADSVVVISALTEVSTDSPLADFYQQLGLPAMESFGSGFVVDRSGLVVTNHHVVQNAKALRVKLRDGTVISQVAKLAQLPVHDLALLQIDAKHLRPVVLAGNEAVRVGDPAIAIGCPQGLEYTLTTGIVSALRKQDQTSLIQMQTTVAPGSSGGPLFANDGAVIGVNTATEGAGLNHAVRVQHIRQLLDAPRTKQPYAPFSGRVEVRSLRLEGLEAGPTERANLAELLRLWGAALDQCLKALPERAYIAYRFESGGLGANATRETNLANELAQCSSIYLRMLEMQSKMLLLQNHADRFASGFVVSAELAGLRAAKDKDATLRISLEFGGGQDEGDADAGPAGRDEPGR
jgi:S1-C subfamily serine protease